MSMVVTPSIFDDAQLITLLRDQIFDACCISTTRISDPKKMFHFLLKKRLAVTTTFKLFGHEIRVAEIRHASKICQSKNV